MEAKKKKRFRKQRRRKVLEAEKLKGFSGVSGAIYGVSLLKGKNNIIIIKGQKSIKSGFPSESPALHVSHSA